MLTRQAQIAETSLRGLHPGSIEDPDSIRRLLDEAASAGAALIRGLNADIDLEIASIELVTQKSLVLRTQGFSEREGNGQVFLRFDHDGYPYFFMTRRIAKAQNDRLVVEIPSVIFRRERRDRMRSAPDVGVGEPRRVEILAPDAGIVEGDIQDHSTSGLGVYVPQSAPIRTSSILTIRFLDGSSRGRNLNYEVRSAMPAKGLPGWMRIGLLRADAVTRSSIDVEYREDLQTSDLVDMEPGITDFSEEPIDQPRVLRLAVQGVSELEELVCLVDQWGVPKNATAVVISSGWGQSKEALLPLARTLVSTFRAHGLPIIVVRFDGIRKRGESYTEPECRIPGREAERYVLSQGVRDINEIVRHLRRSPEHGVQRVVLVSFSASAIEARKAVANDHGESIDGWISVVGSPDLQSMARSISGGIDYVGGHERGLRFGIQELLGVSVDIDLMANDAAIGGMSFLDDSRRDLERIEVPISWFHGRYDAWVDINRVRDVLSHGQIGQRRLVVLPTGHQIKSSKKADAAFRLISREVGLIALHRNLRPVSPPTRLIRRLQLAERDRLKNPNTDLRSFWRDYLVGRDRSLGIELLTAGSSYKSMMACQVAALDVRAGHRIADLGCGTGAFSLALARDRMTPEDVEVISFDYVREALSRIRVRLNESSVRSRARFIQVESNLDIFSDQQHIPIADCSVDRVIASLFIGYLEKPERVMMEIRRILRPGGRLVISTLCRDADISRLYVESFAELQARTADIDLPELADIDLTTSARNFLNDASKILELESAGSFKFMDPEELFRLAAESGFEDIQVQRSLGSPAQAAVLSACRRDAHVMRASGLQGGTRRIA